MGLTPPRRYWLTGAGNGLGASLAEAILDTGAHLAASSRSVQFCEALSVRYPGQVLALPGDLTDSQTVREIGEQIARRWGSLDTVILNAGTAEYIDGQPPPATFIEHLLRSNLLAASYCVDTAQPLLRAGTAPHLVGIASPATYLPLSHTEAGGAMRYLFESTRVELAAKGIDVTLVHPGFDSLHLSLESNQATALRTVDEAAAHILNHLIERPAELELPVAALTTLWPLPASAQTAQTDTAPSQANVWSPIKGQP